MPSTRQVNRTGSQSGKVVEQRVRHLGLISFARNAAARRGGPVPHFQPAVLADQLHDLGPRRRQRPGLGHRGPATFATSGLNSEGNLFGKGTSFRLWVMPGRMR